MERKGFTLLLVVSLIMALLVFTVGPAIAQDPSEEPSPGLESSPVAAEQAPTEEVLPTEVPTEEAPPTEVPTEEVPPTEVPTEEAPPTEVPTEEAPPTEEVPTEVPTEEAPPTEEVPAEVPTEETLPTEEIVEEPIVEDVEETIVEPAETVEESIEATMEEISSAAISVSSANTSFQVQNLSSENTTVMAQYYRETGALAVHTQNIPVAAYSSVNIYQPNVPGLPSPFKGSVVLSSGQPIGAVGGMTISWSNGKQGGANYSGLSQEEIGKTIYLPNISKKFGGGVYSTKIVVQNTGAGTSVTVRYYRSSDGVQITGATETRSIPQNGSTTFEQINNHGLPDGFLGGAVVTSSVSDIAVVVNVYNDQGRLQAYNGFKGGSTSAYAPTLLRNFGGGRWTTSFQIMALEAGTTDVTVQYYGPTGLVHTASYNGANALRQYQSVNRYQGNDTFMSSSQVYAARVTATKKVVVIVNQAQGGGGIGTSSYNGFSAGKTKFFLPAILKYFGAGNYISSFQIMNVGTGAAANVTVRYYNQGSSTPFKTVRYQPGGDAPPIPQYRSVNRFLASTTGPKPDAPIPNGWIGSVVVESTNGVPIVVIASHAGYAVNGDGTVQYNGVGQ